MDRGFERDVRGKFNRCMATETERGGLRGTEGRGEEGELGVSDAREER